MMMALICLQFAFVVLAIERAGNKIAEAIEKASRGSTAKEAK